MVKALDVGKRVLERHAIGEEADVFLELLQRRLGVRAKVAIVDAAGKAQRVECPLQCLHVRAVEIGQAQVERAVTEFVRGVDQRTPCGAVDLVARLDAFGGAEGTHRLCGGGAVLLGGRLGGINGISQRCEARLNVFDGRPLHSRCEGSMRIP